MSIEQTNASPLPPTQFQEVPESEWLQNNADNGGHIEMPLQWTELLPPQQVPMESSIAQNTQTFNNFNFDGRNIFDGQFGNDNGPRVHYGSPSNGAHSGPPVNRGCQNGIHCLVTPINQNGQRPGWNTAPKTVGIRKPKRIRTAFRTQQIIDLEQEYARTRYLDRTRRMELAKALNLNERTIKIWFQNRRMKEKREKVEGFNDTSTATDSSSAEHHVMQIGEPYQQPGYYMDQYPRASTADLSRSAPMLHTVQGPLVNNYHPAYPIAEERNQCQQMPLMSRANLDNIS